MRLPRGRLAAALGVGVLVGVILGAPAPVHATTVVRFGCIPPEGSRYMLDLRQILGEIERLTDGEIMFKIFAGGRLGDEKDMALTLADPNGQLDMLAATVIGVSYNVPEARMFLFPGLFQTFGEVDFIENKYGDEYVGYFDKAGYVLLLLGDAGFTHLHSKEAIATYEDFKAHETWLWQDDETTIAAFTLIGLRQVASAMAPFIEKLKKGGFEAWLFPPLAAVAWGIQQHSAYMSDMTFTFLGGAVYLRKDVFDTLSPSTQRTVLAVGKKWEKRLRKSWRKENEKAIEAMKKQGTKLVKWPDEERQKFFQATSLERGNFAKKWGIGDLMLRVAEDLERYRASGK
jgi:TRAP-type C4-dicarboxylate transport system substrate-binding protein